MYQRRIFPQIRMVTVIELDYFSNSCGNDELLIFNSIFIRVSFLCSLNLASGENYYQYLFFSKNVYKGLLVIKHINTY